MSKKNKCKTYGKPKGHLDTQLFPECEGTKYDRNIQRKNRKKKRKKSFNLYSFKKIAQEQVLEQPESTPPSQTTEQATEQVESQTQAESPINALNDNQQLDNMPQTQENLSKSIDPYMLIQLLKNNPSFGNELVKLQNVISVISNNTKSVGQVNPNALIIALELNPRQAEIVAQLPEVIQIVSGQNTISN